MSTEIVVHSFRNQEIREREDGWLCLTDMARAAGKLVGHWAENARTKAFLASLSSNIGIPIMDLTDSRVGGDHAGTWAHPRVAISFAQWCSPEFEVVVTGWVYERITKGYSIDARRLARDPRMLVAIIAELHLALSEKDAIIEAQAPMVEFYADTTAAPNWLSIGDVAKLLNREGRSIGRNRLYEFLRDEGVFFYTYTSDGGRHNSVQQRYIDRGYFMECLTHFRKGEEHPQENYPKIYVSGKGIVFIRELLDKKKSQPN